ncbi:hypothetical protein A1QO_03890 [Vibrio genomosp. F10 str. ZF-129]|uniref:Uncharacterized protein n=1 Tax=Vibrio genomosp. F10 str. ZF-129 TaxID=1187848 RepID=A0A1E5BIJ2_9VIBR|nr:hypothetical protein [Vibrio genomosp. F10]OEE37254.1 hypothetical protein A1QO_03890 [Vibrio genomosp. F10 str. ZF-129]
MKSKYHIIDLLLRVVPFAYLCLLGIYTFSDRTLPFHSLAVALTEFQEGWLSGFPTSTDSLLGTGISSLTINVLVVNMAMLLLITACCIYLAEAARFGSFKSAKSFRDAEYKKANEPKNMGLLQSVQVLDGGFWGSTSSTVCTDNHMFRVQGDVGLVRYGEKVLLKRNEVFFNTIRSKPFSLIQ